MARFVEKNVEVRFYGYCGDYEGNYGCFTAQVPIKVWSNGREIQIDSGEPKIEWIQEGKYTPSVSFDNYSSCSEIEE